MLWLLKISLLVVKLCNFKWNKAIQQNYKLYIWISTARSAEELLVGYILILKDVNNNKSFLSIKEVIIASLSTL